VDRIRSPTAVHDLLPVKVIADIDVEAHIAAGNTYGVTPISTST
jgi:hypothetical protein